MLFRSQHRGQIHVSQNVSVQDHQPALREGGGVEDAPGGAERLRFERVAESHAEISPVAELRLDRLDEVRAGEHDIPHPVTAQQGELVMEEGDVEERDDGLGAGERQRTKPGALAARQDYRGSRGVQGSASLMSMTGMPSRIG